MPQAEGILGGLVDRMIRRSVRKCFHGVHWIPPETPIPVPSILMPNHHGWHDGYLMHHVATTLKLPMLLWVQEFDAFPLFAHVGGMPFPPDDLARRAVTIRKTIRALRKREKVLLLFGEGVIHPPPTVLPFGRSVDLVLAKAPEAPIIPVAIKYQYSMHERPEAFIMMGAPMALDRRSSPQARLAVTHLLDELSVKIHHDREVFQPLVKGTLDVNERWDMRRIIRR